jgi:hypothetical protein
MSKPSIYLFMPDSQSRDLRNLMLIQAAATILWFPTCGMSLAWNFNSLEDYNRKWND